MKKLTTEEMGRLSVEKFRASEKLPLTVVLDNVRSLNNIGSVFRTSDAFRVEHIALCGITATPPHREIHKTALGAEESVEWSYHEDTAECVRALKEQGYKIYAVEQVDDSIKLGTQASRLQEIGAQASRLQEIGAQASRLQEIGAQASRLHEAPPITGLGSMVGHINGTQASRLHGLGAQASRLHATGTVAHPEAGETPAYPGVAIILGNEIEGVQESLLPLCDGCLEIPQYGTKHSLNVSCAAAIVIWELFKMMKL